jgi:hypothetical protein
VGRTAATARTPNHDCIDHLAVHCVAGEAVAVGWAEAWVWEVATVTEEVVVRRGALGGKQVRRAAEAVVRGSACRMYAT